MRQVLLAPRELDLSQLGDAQSRWVILTPSTRTAMGWRWRKPTGSRPTGFPSADPKCSGRSADAQPQGDPSRNLLRRRVPQNRYSSGPRSPSSTIRPAPRKCTRATRAGRNSDPIPWSAAGRGLGFGDPNIVLSDALTSESRMMIRRGIRERLGTLAAFLTWDPDAYLVIGDNGRMVWIVDGYTARTRILIRGRFRPTAPASSTTSATRSRPP